MPDIEFNLHAADYAREVAALDGDLRNKFVTVIECLSRFPELAGKKKRGGHDLELGCREYVEAQAVSFKSGRAQKLPKPPTTVPDEMVSLILRECFDVDERDLSEIKLTHQLSMGAENFVGEMLERYLAKFAEPLGWVWCSGSAVKKVDFIRPPEGEGEWTLLQVKNRDNSENSSSASVRVGMPIEKWHRSLSRSGETNWDACPIPDLSESGFREFAVDYFAHVRSDA